MLLPLLIKPALVSVVCPPLKTAIDIAWEFTHYSLTWKVLHSQTLRAQVPKSFALRQKVFYVLSPLPGTQPGANFGSVICCCRFNVNHGSYLPFQTCLGQGLITQTILSAYLLSKCIFLHVHFCLPNTVWYECELSEPGVHWKSRDCREQAGFCKMQFYNKR